VNGIFVANAAGGRAAFWGGHSEKKLQCGSAIFENRMRLRRNLSPLCSALLVFQLFTGSAAAQDPAPGGKLNLLVLEGEGAINSIRKGPAALTVVRVEDENQRPVHNAAVVFTLPSQGPSGSFPNGSHTATVVTDAEGKAVARGLKPNAVPGRMEMQVSASSQGRTARTVVTLFNMDVRDVRSGGGGGGKVAAILVVLGAAAAGGLVVGLRQSRTAAPPVPTAAPPITLTPGTGAVAPPQ
jgi:hypothetical protein